PPPRGDRDRWPADSFRRLAPDAGRRPQPAGDDVPRKRGLESWCGAARARGARPVAPVVVLITGTRYKSPAAGERPRDLRACPAAPARPLRPALSPARRARARDPYRRGGIRFQKEGSSKPSRQTLMPLRPNSYISGSFRRSVSVL